MKHLHFDKISDTKNDSIIIRILSLHNLTMTYQQLSHYSSVGSESSAIIIILIYL